MGVDLLNTSKSTERLGFMMGVIPSRHFDGDDLSGFRPPIVNIYNEHCKSIQ